MAKHAYNITTLPEDAPREPEEASEAPTEPENVQTEPEYVTLTSEALKEILDNYAISIRRDAIHTNFELVQGVLHKVLIDESNQDEVDTVRAQLLQLLDETFEQLKSDSDKAYADLEEKSAADFQAKYGASTVEPVGEELQPE